MATWLDIFSLVATFTFFVGTIAGVLYLVQQASQAVQSTKDSLKNKGWNISDKGVSVKTSHRFNREDYVDATQRTLVKALSSSTYGSGSSEGTPKLHVLERTPSSISSHSTEEKKKGLMGGIRKTLSGRSLRS